MTVNLANYVVDKLMAISEEVGESIDTIINDLIIEAGGVEGTTKLLKDRYEE